MRLSASARAGVTPVLRQRKGGRTLLQQTLVCHLANNDLGAALPLVGVARDGRVVGLNVGQDILHRHLVGPEGRDCLADHVLVAGALADLCGTRELACEQMYLRSKWIDGLIRLMGYVRCVR